MWHSRATTLAGLQVQNFSPTKVTVHPKVLEFAEELERGQANQMSKEDDEVNRRTFASDGIPDDKGWEI